MKKFTLLALVFALILSLCACGRKNKETSPTTVPTTTSGTRPTTYPTMDTMFPETSEFMDSGLLDTSESTDHTTDATMTPAG